MNFHTEKIRFVSLAVICAFSAFSGGTWQPVKNAERFVLRKGDPGKTALDDAIPGKLLVVEGKDGALTVVYNAAGELRLKSVIHAPGTETTFTIRRFEQKGFSKTGRVRFLCSDEAGKMNFGFCVSPENYYIHTQFDRFRQLTGRPPESRPWQFHFVRTSCDEYLCTTLKRHFN